jgi:putative flippase GtrA
MLENKISTTIKKFQNLFLKFWALDFFRFLFVGGINTVLGFILTLALRIIFFSDDPKVSILGIIEFDVANTWMYLLLFPVSYTLQALVTFRTRWTWKRLIQYPLSSIPNYGLNQLYIFLYETHLSIPSVISYGLSAILPIPIMYIIIKFLVVGLKKKSN